METLVLLSGGLDSAVLLAHAAQQSRVHPVYVSVGLAWEAAERAILGKLLAAPAFADGVAPLAVLEFSMRDVYANDHWAILGRPPAYDTPEEEVYLAGRNLVLLTKAGVMAASRNITRIALGPLAGNPFPDATSEFFHTMARALTLGLNHHIEVIAPFASLHKEDVIKMGARLAVPLDLTLSCMNPTLSHGSALHCGQCSKCRERRDAFVAAGVTDATVYANRPPR